VKFSESTDNLEESKEEEIPKPPKKPAPPLVKKMKQERSPSKSPVKMAASPSP